MALKYWLIITGLGIVWGSSFFFNAVLNIELDPLWISAGRVAIGAITSWILVIALRRKFPAFSWIYLNFLFLGTISYAVPFAIFPMAQHALPSGAAAIINAFTPLMTVAVSHFWPNGERATLHKLAGVVAGLIGVGILASPALAKGGSAEIWAIAACLLATLCYAFALNYTRNFKHIDPVILGACALTGATVSAAIAALFVHGAPGSLSGPGIWALLGIGVLATALAFQIMYRLLPIVGGTNFSVTTFIAPVSAIILGALFLDEQLEPSHFMGMAAIFVGLLLIDGRLLRRYGLASRT